MGMRAEMGILPTVLRKHRMTRDAGGAPEMVKGSPQLTKVLP